MPAARTIVLPARSEPADLTTGSILFIGTATVLIRYAGFTVLTDPNFLHRGDRVHLGYGLQSHRLTDPALEIHDLPPLDLVVLSHLHEDHFDRVAERELDHALPIFTTRQAARVLKRKGFRATVPFATWSSRVVAKGPVQLRITAMPGQHGPGPLSAALPPVMGSMLDFSTTDGTRGFRLYITGDTLLHDRLHEIPRRYPDIDLALLHLGGTRIFGVTLTMTGDHGVRLLQIVEPRLAIPIHYNDYPVFKSPLADFQRAVTRAGFDARVRYLRHGESYTFQVPARAERASEE